MKISYQEAHYYLSRKNWLTATIQQIKKDLFWQNIDLQLSVSTSMEELQEQLSQLFSYLEQDEYQTFLNILYRVDIVEEHIQKAMSETLDVSFSDVIAKLLINRCLLKVLIKYHFSNQENRVRKDFLINKIE